MTSTRRLARDIRNAARRFVGGFGMRVEVGFREDTAGNTTPDVEAWADDVDLDELYSVPVALAAVADRASFTFDLYVYGHDVRAGVVELIANLGVVVRDGRVVAVERTNGERIEVMS